MKQIQHLVILISMTCALLLTATPTVFADEEALGVAVKAGTTGLGVELSVPLLPHTRIRSGFSYLSYSFDSTIDDINYEFEPEYNALSLLLDVHPFGGSFFMSGGVYFNNNSIAVTGSLDEASIPATYDRYAYLADMISVSGDVDFNPVAPYAGIGWRTNSNESGWGFVVELGVLFQGAPDVKNLRVNAPVDVNGSTEVQQFLTSQEQEIEEELDWFEFYPVASATLVYHF